MMSFVRSILLMTICLGLGSTALAEAYRRLTDFEWEPIEGAKGYEVELHQTKKNGKTFNFKVSNAVWAGKLSPGGYVLRLRALDERGVPGDWSAESPFNVGLENVTPLSPKNGENFRGRDEKESKVSFEWKAVPMADHYHFAIKTEDGSFKKEEDLSGTKMSVSVPSAKAYTWSVTAVGAEETKSDTESVSQFNLLGPKLTLPKIEKPENEFVRELHWKRPDYVESYDLVLAHYNPQTKKWEKIKKLDNSKVDSVAVDEKWPGGTYKLVVKAKGPLRQASDVSTLDFRLHSGNRSPAAEFTHEVRKSIDRTNGWYGIASYLITSVNYSSNDFDVGTGAHTAYSAVGGTGRLGAGYFAEDHPWGFLGILDMSGFSTSSGQTLTYMSMEFSSVWRKSVGDRGELRVQSGLYYKEHQVAQVSVNSSGAGQVDGYSKASVIGPHVGAEYWYSLTPKWGFQLNAHLYLSMMKLSSPNGQDIQMTPSDQLGFLASYRVTPRFTGLAGIAQREDKLKYKSSSGSTDDVTMSGTYLNFVSEYNF